MIAAFIVSLLTGGSFVAVGFAIGRAYERHVPAAPVYVLPNTSMGRHPSHHHRPARHVRTVHDQHEPCVVVPLFDFEQQENEPA